MPSAAGFTACQMSTYGWPMTSTSGSAHRGGDPALLGPGDEVVDEHADPPAGPGGTSRTASARSSMPSSGSTTTPSIAQVVAPDPLDQRGVVHALDPDPAGPGDPGRRVGRPRRTRRRSWRGRRRAGGRRGPDERHRPAVEQEAGRPAAGTPAACRAGPRGTVPLPRVSPSERRRPRRRTRRRPSRRRGRARPAPRRRPCGRRRRRRAHRCRSRQHAHASDRTARAEAGRGDDAPAPACSGSRAATRCSNATCDVVRPRRAWCRRPTRRPVSAGARRVAGVRVRSGCSPPGRRPRGSARRRTTTWSAGSPAPTSRTG